MFPTYKTRGGGREESILFFPFIRETIQHHDFVVRCSVGSTESRAHNADVGWRERRVEPRDASLEG
jgi:hypothetical protein